MKTFRDEEGLRIGERLMVHGVTWQRRPSGSHASRIEKRWDESTERVFVRESHFRSVRGRVAVEFVVKF